MEAMCTETTATISAQVYSKDMKGKASLLCELCLRLMLPVIWLVQAQQVMSWGAEGVIVGSALVKALGEAPTPEAGLQAMKALAQQLRDATRSWDVHGDLRPAAGAHGFGCGLCLKDSSASCWHNLFSRGHASKHPTCKAACKSASDTWLLFLSPVELIFII